MPEPAHPGIAVPAGSSQGITARRIKFVPQGAAAGKIRREFCKPRSCVAVEESLPLSDLPVTKVWPEPFDHLLVLCFSQKPSAEWQRFITDWLAPPELTESPRPVVIEGKGQKVQWRPGRAVIEAKEVNQQEVLAALTDFAFFEGELRDLEAALRVREADVHTDVRRAYSMRYRDRRHWPRFTEMIQCFSGMRLTYAQLEPWLIKGARNLPDASRGWYARLLRKTQVDPRLEDFSNRLEACEDLYEGAHDRINDFLGYFYGHLLEVAIVIFLVAEVAIGSTELWLHFQEYRAEKDEPAINKITPPINKEPQTAALDKVLNTVRKRYPEAKNISAKELIEDGNTFFEVTINHKGEDITVTLTPSGKIEEISKEIDDAHVPKVVKDTLEAKYPKSDIKEREEVYSVDKDDKESLKHYRFKLESAEKKTLEVTVLPNGTFPP